MAHGPGEFGDQLLSGSPGRQGGQVRLSQWKPLLVNPVGGVMYASPASGIKRVEDIAKTKDLIYGGISAIGLDLIPLSFELLELDTKGVLGFKGRGEARIAFERGETNIDYQTTPAYNATVVPLIKEGKAIPLMSFGQLDDKGNIIRDPAVPDLPTVPELYEKLKGKKPSGRFWETYKILCLPPSRCRKFSGSRPILRRRWGRSSMRRLTGSRKTKSFKRRLTKFWEAIRCYVAIAWKRPYNKLS
jgi:hypothetical protein